MNKVDSKKLRYIQEWLLQGRLVTDILRNIMEKWEISEEDGLTYIASVSKKIETARKMLLDYLSKRIKEKEITQEELAKKTGFTQSNISRMLSAKFPPTLDNLLTLCEAANCYIFVIDKDADDDLCDTMRNRWGKVHKN
ncbi:MAG: helix-turn-helix transcriptional regulator [Bacteroidetes bacterium]|nr:helix-turn-helix transcriptional regulator [Bacteroidota bacterium]